MMMMIVSLLLRKLQGPRDIALAQGHHHKGCWVTRRLHRLCLICVSSFGALVKAVHGIISHPANVFSNVLSWHFHVPLTVEQQFETGVRGDVGSGKGPFFKIRAWVPIGSHWHIWSIHHTTISSYLAGSNKSFCPSTHLPVRLECNDNYRSRS